MQKTGFYLAHIVSVVFIPLFAPVYVMAIICYHFPLLAGDVGRPGYFLSKYVMLMVAGPFAAFFVLYKMRIISSLTLNSRRDRFIPQLFTLLCYVLCLGRFILSHDSLLLRSVLLTNVILTFMVMVITLWWKISAHTSAISGLLVAMSFLLIKSPPPGYTAWYVAGCASFIAVSLSRLYLRVHSPSQVFAGIALGGSVSAACLLLV